MKRILHIFSTLEVGGYQTRFLSLMQNRDAGHTHIPYAMDGKYDSLAPLKAELTPLDLAAFPKISVLKSIMLARKQLKSIKPDLLITYNWGALEWALAARSLMMPYCTVTDGFGKEEFESELPRRRTLRRLAMHGAKAAVVPSLTLADRAKKSWGIKPPRLRYIPNGIDMGITKTGVDTALFEEIGVTPKHKVITIVAALRPEKNVGCLIEAFRTVADHHENAKLLIVGDGVGRAPLQMLTERIGLKDQVVFLGQQAYPARILAGSSIFALSSDTEQMPISVVEAMAMGLPVVSTNVGDVRRMVCEDNRSYINGLRAGDLASALLQMLDKPGEAARIGAMNKEKALADYTYDRMLTAWNDVFNLGR